MFFFKKKFHFPILFYKNIKNFYKKILNIQNDIKNSQNNLLKIQNDIKNFYKKILNVQNDIKNSQNNLLKIQNAFTVGEIQYLSNNRFLYKNSILLKSFNEGIIREIFLEKHYFHNFTEDFTEDFIVIDIGANEGIATLYFSEQSRVKKVYSYEPLESTFITLLENINMNTHLKNKIDPYQVACYNENTMVKIFTSDISSTTTTLFPEDMMNSFKKSRRKSLEEYYQIQKDVPGIKTSEEIMKIYKKHPDNSILLKIDTEGSEYFILDDLYHNKIFPFIKIVFIETHFKELPSYMYDIYDIYIVNNNDPFFSLKCIKKEK